MIDICRAAYDGDLAEVERLVGQDPGLLSARSGGLRPTPLRFASMKGHVGVVRWLLDQGAAIDQRDALAFTALWLACCNGHLPVVKLLLERGADPTTVDQWGRPPLIIASGNGRLEVVRLLLDLQSVKASINQRNNKGRTALWTACFKGRGGVVRVLLESGTDPTVANNEGITPVAIAKQDPDDARVSAEGRRECVAALEVSSYLFRTLQHLFC
jgi:ankyrin repeat protein